MVLDRPRRGRLTGVVGSLVDLVLPRACLGCRGAGGPLCRRCRPDGSPLVVAGAPLLTVAAAAYADAVRTAVLAYKERGRRDLAATLGAMLARAVDEVVGPPGAAAAGPGRRPLLVPVPSAPAARAARGGDHVRRLARRAAPRCGLRVAPGVLGLVRVPRDSAGLGIADRAANLAGAMRAVPAPAGGQAVIVDDVVTTGATLREARRALMAAGWSVRGAATVAATARRYPERPGAGSGRDPPRAGDGPGPRPATPGCGWALRAIGSTQSTRLA